MSARGGYRIIDMYWSSRTVVPTFVHVAEFLHLESLSSACAMIFNPTASKGRLACCEVSCFRTTRSAQNSTNRIGCLSFAGFDSKSALICVARYYAKALLMRAN